MQSYVPSQVVVYIDKRLPAARDRPAELAVVGPDYAGMLGQVVFMIDRVPRHLLLFGADADAEFGEAVHAIRSVLRVWEAGNHSVAVRPLVAANGLHPLVAIRRRLSELRDEAPGEAAKDLEFVRDLPLRTVLATDLSSMESLLDAGTWKAATVMAGSVTEAL